MASANAPSPPIRRPIFVVEVVRSLRTTGPYVVMTLIAKARPSVGRPSKKTSGRAARKGSPSHGTWRCQR